MSELDDSGRPRPAPEVDELAITEDGSSPRALGSGDRDPVRVQLDEDFFGRGKDDPLAPQNVDAAATEHERRILGRIDARCRAAEARADAAEARAAAAERRAATAEKAAKKMGGRWAWLIAAVTALGALVTPIAILAVKKLNAAAEARGADRELERQRLADHAQVQANTSAIAELHGALWSLNPAGVVRLQGAARGPAPDAPVTP